MNTGRQGQTYMGILLDIAIWGPLYFEFGRMWSK